MTAAEVVTGDFNNVSSTQLSFTTPAAIGTRVLVAVELYEGSSGTAAIGSDLSDDGAHTWTQLGGTDGTGTLGGVAILTTVATATITDITLNPGGSGNYGNWAIVRFAVASDVDDVDTGTGSSTSPAAAALTSTTTDGFVLAVISTGSMTAPQTQPSGWTLHLAENNNSSELAGAIASDEITATGSVTSVFTTPESNAWRAVAVLVKAVEGAEAQDLTLPHISSAVSLHVPTVDLGFAPVTRYMGGTQETGWFGNEALGGAHTTPLVKTFDPPIPAGFGFVVFQTLYNYTPSDASLLTLDGSGNTLTLTPGAQRAHDSAGGNDNSVTFYHCVLASDCASCTFDPTSLPGGDNGRYGQIVFYAVKDPDTTNGFFTATPVTNVQTTTTSVNPGTLSLPTTNCLELFGSATRNHADQLLPVVESPDEWPDELKHEYFDTIPGGGVDYPAAFQNSIISSGAVAGRVNTSGTTSTPVWTFTGPTPATATALSVLVAYNILGGSIPSQDVEPPVIASTATLHAPTLTVGAVSLSLPHLASTVALHVPTLGGGTVAIALPTITGAVQLFAPVVSADALAIVLPHLVSTLSLTVPTIGAGAVSLALAWINNTATFYGMTVAVEVPGDDSDEYERFIREELPAITLTPFLMPASQRPSQN